MPIIISIAPAIADLIVLNDSSVVYGELLQVNIKGIIVEFASGEDSSSYDQKVMFTDVDLIVDKNGTILFQDKHVRVSNLADYYIRQARSFEPTKIKLNDGQEINAYVIQIARDHLLVRFPGSKKEPSVLYNQTLIFTEVNRIVDQSGTILFQDKRVRVSNLEDYYFRPARALKPVNIKLNNGQEIIAYVIQISTDHLLVRLPGSKKKQNISKDTISEINNGTMEVFQWQWRGYESERVFDYPHVLVEIGYTRLSTNMSALQTSIGATFAEDTYGAINLGLLLAINPYLSAGFTGHFLLDFGTGQSDENDSDAYRLALFELRFGWPFELIKPWIGISGASQSIVLFPNPSYKWKSQSWGIGYGIGLEYYLTDFVHVNGVVRYISISEKNVTPETDHKIDLSNSIFSLNIQIAL